MTETKILTYVEDVAYRQRYVAHTQHTVALTQHSQLLGHFRIS